MPETRSAEIVQLKTLVQELKIQLAAQKEERNDSVELNELRAELSELRSQIVERNPQGEENFKLPDPFKYLSEFSAGGSPRIVRGPVSLLDYILRCVSELEYTCVNEGVFAMIDDIVRQFLV